MGYWGRVSLVLVKRESRTVSVFTIYEPRVQCRVGIETEMLRCRMGAQA